MHFPPAGRGPFLCCPALDTSTTSMKISPLSYIPIAELQRVFGGLPGANIFNHT